MKQLEEMKRGSKKPGEALKKPGVAPRSPEKRNT
jgi:hypothetical protein